MQLDLTKIEETPHLLSILLEVEDVLDSLDIYVFKNWVLGEVVQGPRIKRYWISLTLMYSENRMPDPRAGLRLLKHGILVKFRKSPIPNSLDGSNVNVWLVELTVPRKLIDGMNQQQTDYYDSEVDVEDVSSAIDMGIDSESGYIQGDGK